MVAPDGGKASSGGRDGPSEGGKETPDGGKADSDEGKVATGGGMVAPIGRDGPSDVGKVAPDGSKVSPDDAEGPAVSPKIRWRRLCAGAGVMARCSEENSGVPRGT